MGKKDGTSWLSAVKRAFRSPTKETQKKRREDHDPSPDLDEKKREKRKWIFRKPASQEPAATQLAPNVPEAPATAPAAEAVVVEVSRNTRRPSNQERDNYAAIVIQTAFRGYLARRALCALKGLVKLQALVRGHNVRKQAKMTLKCMQALVRVQARVLDQRMRLSHEGSRKSAFSDTASIWDSRYVHDVSDRKSMSQSREGSSVAEDWDERPHTIEEVKAMLQHRRDDALKRDKAFSQQMRRQSRSPSMGNEDEFEERPKWLDRWMATKPWDGRGRASTDHRDPIKTVEMDTAQPYSYLAPSFRRTNQTQTPRPSSPIHHRAHHSPVTPSPSKTRPIQVRSASPRCGREDRSFHTSQTPSLRSNYYYSGSLANQHQNARGSTSGSSASGAALPNYMAATESAKARVRSQSAPRQRPSTPERERSGSVAKKRLSYPVPDPYGMGYGGYGGNNLRSPSFKSVANSHFGVEQQSNYSSCYAESIGGEISPCSTSDLRRWLR